MQGKFRIDASIFCNEANHPSLQYKNKNNYNAKRILSTQIIDITQLPNNVANY